MFSLIKSLFTSDRVVEGISSGLDKSFYTDEEKRDHFQTLLSLYEPFKVAQRLLALTFSIPYAFAWLVAFMASFWVNVKPQFELLTNPDGIAPIVLMINVFYFGGGALEGIVRKFTTTEKKPKE